MPPNVSNFQANPTFTLGNNFVNHTVTDFNYDLLFDVLGFEAAAIGTEISCGPMYEYPLAPTTVTNDELFTPNGSTWALRGLTPTRPVYVPLILGR